MASLSGDLTIRSASFSGNGDEPSPQRVAGVPVGVWEAGGGREPLHVDRFASGERAL